MAPLDRLGVLLLGDTHGRQKHILKAFEIARRSGIKKVIQLGDFGFFWAGADYTKPLSETLERLDLTLDFLEGNHEDFNLLRPFLNSAEPVEIRPRIRYLPRGYVWEINGYKVMSLGGAVSMDQDGRIPGISWFPDEEITTADIDRACERGPVDLFLSHDAPNTPTLNARLDKTAHIWPETLLRSSLNNRRAIEMVVDKVKPKLIVHGHYHYRYTDTYNSAQVIGLNCDGSGDKSWLIL